MATWCISCRAANRCRAFHPTAPASVSLCVADGGEGIAAEALPRLFQRFGQVGSTGGTGLGLYFCRLVAEAHGGTVAVHNRPSGGAVFSLRLPIGQGDPRPSLKRVETEHGCDG